MKKISAYLLALSILCSICLFPSCGKKEIADTAASTVAVPTETTAGETAKQEDPASADTAAKESVPEETKAETESTENQGGIPVNPLESWDGYSKLPGFEDVDFRGKTFVFMTEDGKADGFPSDRDIYTEDGVTAIDVAVRERNKAVESLYNCKIECKVAPAAAPIANAEVTSGKHTIDVYTTKYAIYRLATDGYCYNLKTLGIDFSNPWWNQNYVKAYTCKTASGEDVLYSILGDFTLSAFANTHALIFNKDVYKTSVEEKLGYDIYDLVKTGKWTMDVFTEMVKAAAVETSGNSQFNYNEGDIMGWVRTAHATHGLHVASDLPILSNHDGVLQFEVSENTGAWSAVIDKAIELWKMPEGQDIGYMKVRDALSSSKTLFASEIIAVLEALKNAENTSLGVVPYPKYSEEQANYAHYVDNHVFSYSVPTSVTELAELGQFLEVFAAHSRKIVRPAWIDTYAYEYCSDAESAEMLNIILDSRTFDPGYLLISALEGELSQMISGGKNNVPKWSERRGKTIAKEIDEFIKNVSDNKA